MSEDREACQRGRPIKEQKRARDTGIELRNNIRDCLEDNGLTCQNRAYHSLRNKYNRPSNTDTTLLADIF